MSLLLQKCAEAEGRVSSGSWKIGQAGGLEGSGQHSFVSPEVASSSSGSETPASLALQDCSCLLVGRHMGGCLTVPPMAAGMCLGP